MATERIGLIGLGLLGTALASRLVASGLAVVGFDVDSARRDSLKSNGGECAANAAEVVSTCRRTVLSLPNSSVVLAVLDEIEPHLQPGSILIDTTTGDPEDVERVGKRLQSRGVVYLDATVGGSSLQVETADALIMAGGDRAAYDECEDILAAFAKQRFFLGPCGSGARMKLVLNLAIGLHRAVLAEALSFASRCQLPAVQALEILKAGPAYSAVMDAKGEKMLTGNFEPPQARLSQHLKDVRLMLASAERCEAKLPLTEVHRSLLESAEAAGYGAADNSAIIKAFE